MVEDVLKTKPGPAGQATLLAEQLSDLDGVGRRALTDLVAAAPEGNTARGLGVRDVATHATTQIRSWSDVSIGMGKRSCASSALISSTSFTPGAAASAARASSTVMSRSNSSVMLSECERSTGTRTQVQFTRSSADA